MEMEHLDIIEAKYSVFARRFNFIILISHFWRRKREEHFISKFDLKQKLLLKCWDFITD